MAYCNWCQLESENDDVCVWCKRPLGTSQGVYQQARSDLHFLRSSEDGGEPTPIFAIVGALVLLGLVAGAILTFHSRSDQASNESDHWVLKDQAPEQAAPSAETQPAAFAPTPAPAPLYVPPSHQIDDPKTDKHSSARVITMGDSQTVVKNNGPLAGVKGENSLYFEGADFSAVVDKKGEKHLVGDVVVVNDTYGNLQSGSLWLRAGNSQFNLERYDGSINAPHFLGKFAVSGKASLKCHVLVKDLNPNVNFSGKRVLGLEGNIGGQPVHVEDELIVTYK